MESQHLSRILDSSVGKKRPCADGGVEAGGRVTLERKQTNGSVVCAAAKA